MSMILEALSRAEKERQNENMVGLDTARYVTSSTIKEDRFKRWVLIALVANFALIIILSIGYVWKNKSQSNQVRQVEIANEPSDVSVQPNQAIAASVDNSINEIETSFDNESIPAVEATPDQKICES